MVLHEELPIPVSSLLEPAYGEWSQQEELRSNDFQTLRNFRARSSFANSSGAPIGSLVTFVVSDITLKSQKFKNVAYMKMNQIQKIMNYERNPIGSFPQMKSKKSCHVMVNDKLVVEVREDNTMNEGIIALDAMQCEFANTSDGDLVSVQLFEPTNELNMAELKVVVYILDKGVKLNYDALQLELRNRFKNQIMIMDQKVLFHTGAYFKVTCIRRLEQANECDNAWGKITKATAITIRRPKGFNKEIQMRNIEETLISLGIGGIGPTFRSIIQKAFASRFLSPTFCKRLNINHVRGMVLYGPPGTGKTLLMRKLAELLDVVEPKVVNGPELLVKWVGESEQNVRSLFSEARKDYEDNGDNSSLHIIIIDELDSIARRRGQSTQSEMRDGIVNQLLTMIDGFSGINNIFIVGTTNRLDLIDSALLRPGRLELLLEVGAPDEAGRLEILKVHTQNLAKTSLLESDVNLEEIASLTPNWTGADLAGLTRFALSNAINRIMENTIGQVEEKKIKVNQADLKFGIEERCVTKNFTVNKLEKYRSNVLVDISCVPPLSEACERVDQFAKKLWRCKSHHFLSCLLAGPSGCGKTTLAAHIVQKNRFKHVNMVHPESMVDFSEKEKSQKLVEIFEDALKFSSSLIILDDVERLVGHTEVGQYPKAISETLKCLLKKHVTEDIKVLVLGTTSEENILEKIGIFDVFTLQVVIPPLKDDDLKKILLHLNIRNEDVIKAAVSKKISLKKLHLLIDLISNENAHDCSSGQKHIDEGDFLQYLSYINMSAGELAQGRAQAQAQATEREILTCDRERNSQLHDQQILELRSQISNLQSQIQALTEDFRSANLGVSPAAVATHVQPPMPPSQPSSSHNGELS
ncbi:vesicle-fusing ATPase [Quercus suber]|uniref:vesicle-fusing ATPase n=1 Tax=Quercus suber TaxID=58331 RepID=UPI0032E03515